MSREFLRNKFIARSGFNNSQLEKIQDDLSTRNYFRIRHDLGSNIVMDCPPDTNNFHSFIDISKYLFTHGFSVPEIYDIDLQDGFILMEDFGHHRISDILSDDFKLPDELDEEKIYKRTIDVLVKLHSIKPMENLQNISDDEYILESTKFIEYYADIVNGEPLPEKLKEEFQEILKNLLNISKIYTPVMMLKDYHVENLFWLPDRAGLQKIGLIDYQDAKIASPAYDIVSILEDARRDVSPELTSKMISHYLKSFPNYDRKDFMTAFHILGAQRNLKIIGQFACKASKDKHSYLLQLLPRVIGYLKNDLKHPILLFLKEWLEKAVPQRGVVSALTYGSGNTRIIV